MSLPERSDCALPMGLGLGQIFICLGPVKLIHPSNRAFFGIHFIHLYSIASAYIHLDQLGSTCFHFPDRNENNILWQDPERDFSKINEFQIPIPSLFDIQNMKKTGTRPRVTICQPHIQSLLMYKKPPFILKKVGHNNCIQ